MTVKELCEVMDSRVEINLISGPDPIPFERHNALCIDAFGSYVIGKVSVYPATTEDPTPMIEVDLKVTPVKSERS